MTDLSHLASRGARPAQAERSSVSVGPDNSTALLGDDASDAYVTDIYPSRGWASLDLRALWRYRELVYFLVWRDVKVRYKQTVLGAAWAILQPLLTMVAFSLFFGKLGHMPSDGIPYPLFSLAGLVPWTFFAFGMTESANSLVLSQQLLKKVYFPRLAIPLATVLAGLVDFALAFALLVIAMLWYGIVPGVRLLAVPALVLLALITALGIGLWLAALNVQYRDVRYVIPFLTQLWLLATPIAYPSSLLPGPWRLVYAINPMVGVVDGFRWALLGARPPGATIVLSSVVALVLCFTGAMYFRRMERTFADVV